MTLTVKGADISACGNYRYMLWRVWDRRRPLCAWILLNPSTADGTVDDATIRKICAYAKALGWGGVMVVNLFAFRSTDPRVLIGLEPAVAVGPDNDDKILEIAHEARILVAGWGRGGSVHDRAYQVERLLSREKIELLALRVNGDGSPAHPLYLPKDLRLTPLWRLRLRANKTPCSRCGKPLMPRAALSLETHLRCYFSIEEQDAILARYEADPALSATRLAFRLKVPLSVMQTAIRVAKARRGLR